MTFGTLKEKKVVTVPSDSMCPPCPPCPPCCSFLEVFRSPVFVGAVQIMAGIFNIGLGPGRTSTHPDDLANLGAAYWLGGVYLATGIPTLAIIWSHRSFFIFTVIMNIIYSAFATAGIVLYTLDLRNTSVIQMCDRSLNSALNAEDNCSYVAYFAQSLLTWMDVTLIVVTVFQLLLNIPFVVYLFHYMLRRQKDEPGVVDVEVHQPLLQEVLMTRPGA